MVKKLSSSLATGNVGAFFEACVQASFVTLMATGGHSPCLRPWPIVECIFQGKVEGYHTDDFIAIVKNVADGETRKLLCNIKHSIKFTRTSPVLASVLVAAWNDFVNPASFIRGKDEIALITGPLSAIDRNAISWILERAKHAASYDDFHLHATRLNYSPSDTGKKISAFREHLASANGGSDVGDGEFFAFLKSFNVLGYDLGVHNCVVLPLLQSHIAQLNPEMADWVWPRIVTYVQSVNRNAGKVTRSSLPEEVRTALAPRSTLLFPEQLRTPPRTTSTISAAPDPTLIALAALIGSWEEANAADAEIVSTLVDMPYDHWLKKANELLNVDSSPLTLRGGVWRVSDRLELFKAFGSWLRDPDIERLKQVAATVLGELDPMVAVAGNDDLPTFFEGVARRHSDAIRHGLADGLAIIANWPTAFNHCTANSVAAAGPLVVRQLFSNSEWIKWASLSDVTPSLSESAPSEFLREVDASLEAATQPLRSLFSIQQDGYSSTNYSSGLIAALEGLAWDPKFLVSVSILLAEISTFDSRSGSGRRAIDSLATILLPWHPCTLASVGQRMAAVRTVMQEQPLAAWNLLRQLLPGERQSSSGTHKPMRRRLADDGHEQPVTKAEYRQQVVQYAQWAISLARRDLERLQMLVPRMPELPTEAFDELLDALRVEELAHYSEKDLQSLWSALTALVRKHRRFHDAGWALKASALRRIDEVVDALAPRDVAVSSLHLFEDRDYEQISESGGLELAREIANGKRNAAIRALLRDGGIDSVLAFARSVRSPYQVGKTLADVEGSSADSDVLPRFLRSESRHLQVMASGFAWGRHEHDGWGWADEVTQSWGATDKAKLLSELPFASEAWQRAEAWLGADEGLYWQGVSIAQHPGGGDLVLAVRKLLQFDRPLPAIACMQRLLWDKKDIPTELVRDALLYVVSGQYSANEMDAHSIGDLIQYLQNSEGASAEDVAKVEWAYLAILGKHGVALPRFLETRLAADPAFFCEVIALSYRSTNEAESSEVSEARKAMATNAWRLLNEWTMPPGQGSDGKFSGAKLDEWLIKAKQLLEASGHLEVGLINIGEVLIHAPVDPGGLWIHRGAAAALNDRSHGRMRDGYRTATFNARGVHSVDPTGAAELGIAAGFNRKADELEVAGYHRVATMLRELAAEYTRQSARIIEEHMQD